MKHLEEMTDEELASLGIARYLSKPEFPPMCLCGPEGKKMGYPEFAGHTWPGCNVGDDWWRCECGLFKMRLMDLLK